MYLLLIQIFLETLQSYTHTLRRQTEKGLEHTVYIHKCIFPKYKTIIIEKGRKKFRKEEFIREI